MRREPGIRIQKTLTGAVGKWLIPDRWLSRKKLVNKHLFAEYGVFMPANLLHSPTREKPESWFEGAIAGFRFGGTRFLIVFVPMLRETKFVIPRRLTDGTSIAPAAVPTCPQAPQRSPTW